MITAETLFSIANAWVIPGWLLLLIVPNWKYTTRLILYLLILVLSVTYTWMLFTGLENMDTDSFSSLASITSMFSDPAAALTGWIHYLAFDLFVGMMITIDARRIGLHRLIMIIPLFFTFMTGPFGLLIYLVMRYFQTGRAEVPFIRESSN